MSSLAYKLGYNRAKSKRGYTHPLNADRHWTPENDVLPVNSFGTPQTQIADYKQGVADRATDFPNFNPKLTEKT